jgi:hypothetical protein
MCPPIKMPEHLKVLKGLKAVPAGEMENKEV